MHNVDSPSHKPLYILGINEALCASAALLKDGELIAAASEERFSRVKNEWGFPKKAITFVCNVAGILPSQLDLVVLSYIDPYPHFTFHRAHERKEVAPDVLKKLRNHAPILEYYAPFTSAVSNTARRLYYRLWQPYTQRLQIKEIYQALTIAPEKIVRMDHHLAHAYTAYFSNPERNPSPTLVLTCDGAGDSLCACVFLVKNGEFQRVAATTHLSSLGLLYASVTSYLGFKAHEDEHKVMGLAPYGDTKDSSKIYKVLKKLLCVDGLVFSSPVPSRHFGLYLKEHLGTVRFDSLALAIQNFTEDLLVAWVTNAIKATNTHTLAVSGGVFQNVKANQKILKLPHVRKVFFMPSPSDETNSIGACYYGYQMLIQNSIKPLSNLYLGPEYSEGEILKALKKYPSLKVRKPKDMAKTVAKLLAKGEIVARFAGRMEMGSRALGNRSILADPKNYQTIERINKMIKMRDFWLPFAPTILEEYAHLYIKNPKRIAAPFMILTFHTTAEGQRSLAAAIHPYDKTTRPQLLKKEDNPSYYAIIEEFHKLTGVASVLNTSFNLHGEPIVCTPQDALSTFQRSGLRFLALEDKLIMKEEKRLSL